ncbi:potassium-transporting ATPase subunit C [Amycolatopsis sp. PS_44_ISF1]|uniref:potassium-transporting ATPase subunit C n=1 Tax=Amycolatopsis sp. PS_44_ISF1 TaxID=2974917 RepID=UPI0028DD408F|nr:potassium-transporting ATPase subunit C [Amycolatopsis sp. PS_44_ISF1]MDT8915527.1 potassium-transporting ATPase subunit C [Amycolatopsis sp. PS_44_ISF1]
MNTMVKQTWAGLRVLLAMTVLLGLVYPLAVWAVGRIPGLEANAEGSIVTQHGQAVGSSLIGVDPVAADPARDPWFHNRPSAGSKDALGPGDPSTSGASNKGPYNEDLVKSITERKDAIAKREGVGPDQVPADAVTASASGLDPSISVAYADLQIARVARHTGLAEDRVRRLVEANTSGAGIGVPGVNVLQLNLAVQSAAPGAH